MRCEFIDWMKALGITLIVYGHVAHATTVPLTPPVYIKQFGVVCFLFATGFTLAREARPVSEAVFLRLFPIFLFGGATAIVLMLLGAVTGGGLALSNYLPFVLGANVVFDHFPANPSTWYLGTYLHLVLLWAVGLRRVRVRGWMIAAVVCVEVPIRAWLIVTAGSYVAYQLLINWAGVFLLALWWGARASESATGSEPSAGRGPAVLALSAWLLLVALPLTGMLRFEPAFPFMTVAGWGEAASAWLVSALVSACYLAAAVLVFEAARRLGTAPRVVGYLARNSLVIFLVHMPVYFALAPWLHAAELEYAARALVLLAVCLPGLAWMSERVTAIVRPRQLADRLYAALHGWLPSAAALPVTTGGRQ